MAIHFNHRSDRLCCGYRVRVCFTGALATNIPRTSKTFQAVTQKAKPSYVRIIAMEKDALIIYGAVTQPPANMHNTWERGKILLRRFHDRMMYKHLKQHKFDYRNYISKHAYNIGDFAIAHASIQSIKKTCPKIKITTTNWGSLKNPSPDKTPLAICGSGYFFLNSQLQLPSRLHQDLAWIKSGNELLMIYGAGVNLIDPALERCEFSLSSEQLSLLSELLEHCKHISVRDVASQCLLQNCTSQTVDLIGDPALFIETTNVISPGQQLRGGRVNIGINIPFHGPSASDRINIDFRSYVIALKEIQRRTDCLFHYMIHYDSELLVAALLRDSGIQLRVVQGDLDDLLHTYKQLNLHIGGMLHSCILASSASTPAIGLAYDIKHSGFFSLIGLPEHCIPAQPFEPDRIVALALHTLKNEQAFRSIISNRRLELKNKADVFLRSALTQFNQ